MALRYTADVLLHLRDSPLCVRPDSLPPTEDWMGPPAEQARTQTKAVADRPRTGENPLLDQTNRRPALDRVSRNSANPEDIVFAPPRMAFASASARGAKTLENDKSAKDFEIGRFGLRNRSGDLDNERLRDSRTNPLRRRGDADQDSDGWSMVKPRKSFGADGAERFHGKMGGNFRDEKRPQKDRDERDTTRDRAARPFDTLTRDKDVVDGDGRTRGNGLNRSKLDSWHRNDANDGAAATAATAATTAAAAIPEKKERDRTKSWRDREREPEAASDDRTGGRQSDRRWGRDRDQRDQRSEREPEWFDEPAADRREAHTQQDFQKWMEQMKKAKGASSSAPAASGAPAATTPAATVEPPKAPVQPPPAAEAGPDKFFLAFGGSNTNIESAAASTPSETASKAKPAGKSSRFTSFFSQPQDDGRGKTEPPTPLTGPPVNFPAGLAALAAQASGNGPPAPEEEKQAFQQLLAKLQKQTLTATPPGPSPFSAPPQTNHGDASKKAAVSPPEPFQQYGGDRREAAMARPPSQHVQEIHAPRPQQQSARPEQLLQDLVGHHQRVSSQGSGQRPDVPRNNSNTEFLMNLMRAGPDGQRSGPPQQQHMMGMPHQQATPQHQGHHQLPKQQQHMPQHHEAENEYQMRENRGSQRQPRQQPPPGFPMDDSFHGGDHDARPNQPTQILQRPIPPPGLDQMPPSWMTGGGQMPPPPQQRGPMMAPPGLGGGPGRNVPMPHMFPPNFPPGAIPPDVIQGMPPRNMPPLPPPGFFNGPPPHGFMPPGLGGFNGPPGPESHAFGGGPFEGRGMPPPGAGNRGANYGRP